MMGTSGIVGPCILQAAGAGYSFQVLADRSGGRCLFRRRRRQQRRVPRRAQHGQHLEAAGAVRVREQPVRDRGALFVRGRQPQPWPAEAPATGCPALTSTATTFWPSTRPPLRPSSARGAATARRCIECRTYRTRPHAEGMGDYTYRTRDEVEAWKTRCPILRLQDRDHQGALEHVGPVRRHRVGDRHARRRCPPVRRNQPLARPRDRDPICIRRTRVTGDRDIPAPPRAEPCRAKSALCRPRSRACPRKWRVTRRSSSWAKGSVNGGATSRRRPAFTSATARSGSATRRSASADSSAWAAGPP